MDRVSPQRDLLPEDRIARALTRVLPPQLARRVSIECVILTAACRPFRRAPKLAGRYGYVDRSLLKAALPLFPLLLAADSVGLYVLIPATLRWLQVAHIVSTIYLVAWAAGMYTLLRLRPHRLDADALHLHRGLFKSVRVPLADIVTARPADGADDARKSDRFDLTGTPRFELTLRAPVVPMGLLSPLPATTRLLASADDVEGLCTKLAAMSGGATAEA